MFWTSALAFFAATASAFQDASPFFAFSTSSLDGFREPASQVTRAQSVTSMLIKTLQHCPSDRYVFVSQPKVTTQDIIQEDGASHLKSWIRNSQWSSGSSYSVSDVLGSVDTSEIQDELIKRCGAKVVDAIDTKRGSIKESHDFPQIVNFDFDPLPENDETRKKTLSWHDNFLNSYLTSSGQGPSFTVIYTTSPRDYDAVFTGPGEPGCEEGTEFECEDDDEVSMNVELKRSVDGSLERRQSRNNTNSDAGLFEKYNFLSPGIFMGGVGAVIMFLIIYVGISAISSLQVSYAAFSKEMGPAVQKKQQ